MSACREGTYPNNKRRAGNYRAYHRDCFRRRQEKDRCECVVRMHPNKPTIPAKYDVIVLSLGEQLKMPNSVTVTEAG